MEQPRSSFSLIQISAFSTFCPFPSPFDQRKFPARGFLHYKRSDTTPPVLPSGSLVIPWHCSEASDVPIYSKCTFSVLHDLFIGHQSAAVGPTAMKMMVTVDGVLEDEDGQQQGEDPKPDGNALDITFRDLQRLFWSHWSITGGNCHEQFFILG